MSKSETEEVCIEVFKENLRDSKAVREFLIKRIKGTDILEVNEKDVNAGGKIFDSVFDPLFFDKDMASVIMQNKDYLWTPYCFFKVGEKGLLEYLKGTGMLDKISKSDNKEKLMKSYVLYLITNPLVKLYIDFYHLNIERNMYEKHTISIEDEKTRPDLLRKYDLISDRLSVALPGEDDKKKYDELIDALNQLVDTLNKYYMLGEDGRLRHIGSVEQKYIYGLYETLLFACDNVINTDEESVRDQQVKSIAESIKKKSLADFSIFKNVKLNTGIECTLAEILDMGRNKYISSKEILNYRDITSDRSGVDNENVIKVEMNRDENPEILKCDNNASIALCIDEAAINKDNKICGYFTGCTQLSLEKQFEKKYQNQLMEVESNDYYSEALRSILSDLVTRIYKYVVSESSLDGLVFDDNGLAKLGYSISECNKMLDADGFSDYEKACIRNIFKSYVDANLLIRSSYMSAFETVQPDWYSNVDKKNILMYKMSKLLGVEGIVAKTREMIIMMGNHVAYGTFVDRASGVNIEKMYKNVKKILPSDSLDGSLALRDLAEIQILDYIGLNTDRHMGSLYYSFSDKTLKCQSAVGIDNNNSMGGKVPENYKKLDKLIPLDNIKVISERMCRKLFNISEDAFINTLRGHGLTSKEIAAALNRMLIIRDRVESQKIVIVKDSQWEMKKLSDFVDEVHPSLFDEVKHSIYPAGRNNDEVINEEDIIETDMVFKPAKLLWSVPVDENQKKRNEDIQKEKRDVFSHNVIEKFQFDDQTSDIITDADIVKLYKGKAEQVFSLVDGVCSCFSSAMLKDIFKLVKNVRDDAKALEQKVQKGYIITKQEVSHSIRLVEDMSDKASKYTVDQKNQSGSTHNKKDVDRINAVRFAREGSFTIFKELKELLEMKELESAPEEALDQFMEDELIHLKEQKNGKDQAEFKKTLATLIYLNGVRSQISFLKKHDKLVRALMKDEIKKQIEIIRDNPSFINLIKKNNQDSLMKDAMENKGWKILEAYTV